MNSTNSTESYHGYMTPRPGPRPKVRIVGTENGVPVKRCESPLEMKVRFEGLRKPGDDRSPERLVQESFYRLATKNYRRNGDE